MGKLGARIGGRRLHDARRAGMILAVVALFALPGCHTPGHLHKAARDPSPSEVRDFAMARLLERQGQTDKAVAMYEKMVAHNRKTPAAARPYHRLAMISVEKGDPNQAEAYFREAVKRGGEDPEILNDFGYWLGLNNRLAEAETWLRAARRANPSDKMIANNLALVVGQAGRPDEALALFREIGTEAEAQSNLAFVLVKARKLPEARQRYEYALALDPSLKPAQEALVQLAAVKTPASRMDPNVVTTGGTR